MEARYGRYDDLSCSDLEEQHDGREASLGWQNEGSQGLLTAGTNDDREHEHDGREPDVDDEPDYPKPPKGYMHPVDLRCLTHPSLGVKGR